MRIVFLSRHPLKSFFYTNDRRFRHGGASGWKKPYTGQSGVTVDCGKPTFPMVEIIAANKVCSREHRGEM
jgi:hypothetical protein